MSNITINMAAKEYFERLRGKRTPKGTWVSGMYFFPCQQREHERCCKALELETEHNPLALWEHCKSIEHVANRHQVDPATLEARIKVLLGKRK